MTTSVGNGGFSAPSGLSTSGPIGVVFSHAWPKKSFFGPRVGVGFDPALLTQGIGADGCWPRSEILSAYLNWHPVCAHLGPMPDCIEALRDRPGGIRPEKIAAIGVDLCSTALQYDSPTPRIDLAARFNFCHAAALSLCLGPLRHDGFSPERLGGPDVQAMAARIQLVADPRLDALSRKTARPSSRLNWPTAAKRRPWSWPQGRQSRPLTRTELHDKALGLMRAAWGYDDPFHRIYVLLNDTVPDLAEQLGRVLRRGFAPQPG